MRCHDGQGHSTHCRATPLVSRGISNLPHLGSIWTPSHLSDTTYVEHRMLAQSGYFSAFTRLAPHITTAQELKREFNTGGSSAIASSDVKNVYKVVGHINMEDAYRYHTISRLPAWGLVSRTEEDSTVPTT